MKQFDCAEYDKLIPDYLDLKLPAESVLLLEAHLARCPECTRLLEENKACTQLFQTTGIATEEIHPAVLARVQNRVLAEIGTQEPRRQGSAKQRRAWFVWVPVAAAIMVLLIAIPVAIRRMPVRSAQPEVDIGCIVPPVSQATTAAKADMASAGAADPLSGNWAVYSGSLNDLPLGTVLSPDGKNAHAPTAGTVPQAGQDAATVSRDAPKITVAQSNALPTNADGTGLFITSKDISSMPTGSPFSFPTDRLSPAGIVLFEQMKEADRVLILRRSDNRATLFLAWYNDDQRSKRQNIIQDWKQTIDNSIQISFYVNDRLPPPLHNLNQENAASYRLPTVAAGDEGYWFCVLIPT